MYVRDTLITVMAKKTSLIRAKPRDKSVMIRLRAQEYNALVQAANRAGGGPLSAYIREVALREAASTELARA